MTFIKPEDYAEKKLSRIGTMWTDFNNMLNMDDKSPEYSAFKMGSVMNLKRELELLRKHYLEEKNKRAYENS